MYPYAPCTVCMYVRIYTFIHSTCVSLNAGGMTSGGNLFKTLVSKEKRRYKEGGYDLDLTCIPPSSIVSVFMFVCCAIVGNVFRLVDGASLGCTPFSSIPVVIFVCVCVGNMPSP